MTQTFNHTVYFDKVRVSLFKGALTQQQVDGQTAILKQWESGNTDSATDDMRWLAYMLATTYHETGKRMWPVEEIGRGRGKKYGVQDPETKQTYYGRGFVQLTWRENYHKATVNLSLTGARDIEKHAAMALDLVIASRIMFRGMSEGWFTKRKLGQFFNDTKDDAVGARIIINNDVKTMGEKIAGYHDKFMAALVASAQTAVANVVRVYITAPVGIKVDVEVIEGS